MYAIGAKLFLLKVPLEVLQNWVLIQLKDMHQIFENVQQGLIKELFQIIELCLVIGTGEYILMLGSGLFTDCSKVMPRVRQITAISYFSGSQGQWCSLVFVSLLHPWIRKSSLGLALLHEEQNTRRGIVAFLTRFLNSTSLPNHLYLVEDHSYIIYTHL